MTVSSEAAQAAHAVIYEQNLDDMTALILKNDITPEQIDAAISRQRLWAL